MTIRAHFLQGSVLDHVGMIGGPPKLETRLMGYSLETNLLSALQSQINRPLFVDLKSLPQTIRIQVQLTDGVLDLYVSRKRLFTPTTTIFVLWMIGTSLLLLGIATIFMRNQVRSVRRLAAAADSFGKGRDVPAYRPEGAAEVRQAAAAFCLDARAYQTANPPNAPRCWLVFHMISVPPLTRMKTTISDDGRGRDR